MNVDTAVILAPENMVERMKQEIDALHDFYNK